MISYMHEIRYFDPGAEEKSSYVDLRMGIRVKKNFRLFISTKQFVLDKNMENLILKCIMKM